MASRPIIRRMIPPPIIRWRIRCARFGLLQLADHASVNVLDVAQKSLGVRAKSIAHLAQVGDELHPLGPDAICARARIQHEALGVILGLGADAAGVGLGLAADPCSVTAGSIGRRRAASAIGSGAPSGSWRARCRSAR